MTNLLFICTANLNRSKTGEDIFKDRYYTKSAGILCSDTELTTAVNKELLEWADIVFVFEQEHVLYLKQNFPELNKTVVNLQIPDMYPYGDQELVNIIKSRVPLVLKKLNKLGAEYYKYSEI